MRRGLLLLLILIGLGACANAPVREIHRIDRLTIVYTDSQAIKAACQNDRAVGCYIPTTRTIYCQKGDVSTFYHEFSHVLKGNFHAKRN